MNINDRVKVILTDAGLHQYRKFYTEVKKRCDNQPLWDEDIKRTEREFETSLWNLMEIFGPVTYMGAPQLFEINQVEIVE